MSTRCECCKPKPVTVTVEVWAGLFMTTPIETDEYRFCDRCGEVLPKEATT